MAEKMHLSGARAVEYERELALTADASVAAGIQRLADAIDAAYCAEPRRAEWRRSGDGQAWD